MLMFITKWFRNSSLSKDFCNKRTSKANVGFIVNKVNYKEMMAMDTLAYRLYFSDIEK